MKTMKMKLRISLILLATAIGMVSCESLGLSAPKMDTEAAFKRVIESYEKYIDTTMYHPIEINWYEIDKLSNDLSYMRVSMISKDDNKVYSQVMKIAGDNQMAEEVKLSSYHNRSKLTFDGSNWIRPSDINAELFLQQFEDAKTQIPADEYRIKSVSDCKMGIHNKTGEVKNSFEFRLTKVGESTQRRGKQVITNYYEVNFDGQPDGTALLNN